jgi:CRP/FNR family transcriptional regulator, cyclic AMP receptor protein
MSVKRDSKRSPVRKFDVRSFLAKTGTGRKLAAYEAAQSIYIQGDVADSLFYINKGRISISVTSKRGKEAIIAILGHGEFFGEGCLAGQSKRMSTAKAMSASSVIRIQQSVAILVMRAEPSFSDLFLQHLLARTIRIEEDLIDQLFNSSEKRLARALLLLANFGNDGAPETVLPPISQETLAEVVGTTRSRISYFMNKFRKLGYIDYNGHIEVHSTLLNVVLHD